MLTKWKYVSSAGARSSEFLSGAQALLIVWQSSLPKETQSCLGYRNGIKKCTSILSCWKGFRSNYSQPVLMILHKSPLYYSVFFNHCIVRQLYVVMGNKI